eukprot:scaffold64801_cov30-Tisochrysis_lutea.AAC.1
MRPPAAIALSQRQAVRDKRGVQEVRGLAKCRLAAGRRSAPRADARAPTRSHSRQTRTRPRAPHGVHRCAGSPWREAERPSGARQAAPPPHSLRVAS